ncbi:NUDIX hydrolase [Bdellovibrio svalbardensis]|uniref:CoA pyrophosphatase n=1 Tax=Bdellovibrio svalbardensis TaxID=2972972 RepID=A0ABT6DLD7_9BACT|nr:CoA pyrophosphatase [Bdellovibrio svalbardensis]MDG0816890.1 CoA pyrophosphatase [Bdellovibrio svalbardensis]
MSREISLAISSQKPVDLSKDLEKYACVAIILRGPVDNLEIGFIQRAANDSDRWAGQIAFPGGKKEDSDFSDLGAALRETFEEIGIDLLPEELMGRLNDIQARKHGTTLEFFIRPFVFYTEREFTIKLDPAEVADFFWISLNELLNPQRHINYELKRGEVHVELPAISLDRDPPLWGLTYMMAQNLLDVLKQQQLLEAQT